MDEENKQESEQQAPHQHVRIFGAEVNAAGGTTSGDWSRDKAETKEEWRKRKDKWKQQHREQIQQHREQWKAQRHDWHDDDHHGGGMFFGMILLFAGVIALLYTMGFISHAFWYAVLPFWPILLILWGASIILGRHWFARFVLFIFALAFLIIIIFYGLIKTDSPLVSSLSPSVVRAVEITQPQQY